MKKIRITKKSINQIHKFTGIAVCIFLIHLSITGIFLNHTEDLGLDEKYTSSPLVLALYNISMPSKKESFVVNNLAVSRFGNQIFFEDQPILKNENPIVGAVFINQMYVIAFSEKISLFTEEGELIESLTSASGIPTNIEKLGNLDDSLYIKADNQTWLSKDQGQEWILSSRDFEAWSIEDSISEEKIKQIKMYFSGKGVSLEQFLLDLHNGNIIKNAGKWLLDLIAIFLLLLSISGIWIWLRRRRY